MAADTTGTVGFIDGGGTPRVQNITVDGAGNESPQSALRARGAPVEDLNPLPAMAPAIGAAVPPFTVTTSDQAITGLTLPGKLRIKYPAYALGTVTPNTGMVQINYAGGNSVSAPSGALVPGETDDWIFIGGTTVPHVSITVGTAQILIQQ